jgi:hypothetical protein
MMVQSCRLHEIITRIGEICLSPELAHVMLFPTHALSFAMDLSTPLDFPEPYHELCRHPPAILHAMRDIPDDQLSPAQSAKFLATFNASCLPPPTTIRYRQPIHLCAWKIESPSRVVVYTGKHPTPSQGAHDPLVPLLSASFTPHTLSKVLLDERSKRPVPSAIHLLTTDQEFTPAAIRESVLHYAQTQLTPHKERVSLLARSQLQRQGRGQQQQHVSILDHTLEEAAAVFIHAPTRNHSEIALNQSPPWDKDHVDSR